MWPVLQEGGSCWGLARQALLREGSNGAKRRGRAGKRSAVGQPWWGSPAVGSPSREDGGTSCGGAAAAHLAPLCCSEGKGWRWCWGSVMKTPGAVGFPLVTGTRCRRSLGEGQQPRASHTFLIRRGTCGPSARSSPGGHSASAAASAGPQHGGTPQTRSPRPSRPAWSSPREVPPRCHRQCPRRGAEGGSGERRGRRAGGCSDGRGMSRSPGARIWGGGSRDATLPPKFWGRGGRYLPGSTSSRAPSGSSPPRSCGSCRCRSWT